MLQTAINMTLFVII